MLCWLINCLNSRLLYQKNQEKHTKGQVKKLHKKIHCYISHGHLYKWTAMSSFFFWQVDSIRRELETQITPRGWIFWNMIFYNLKNSIQDLSNEGSNFILILFEVGHWAAQTQALFDKLPEITDFLPLACLKRYFF